MSLNGLDHVRVTEAYQAALAEAGGWFLLKYVLRDAVEVLTRGTGGAADARGAIAQYEEKSPLYGFLLYRRRKVLIKYVPEGTSRLLQARVAVHFTAVTDKFTPHDTIISVTTADELSDAALTSACSLHTAAPSSSSSSASSRRHKLDEITEDAEEGQSNAGDSTSTARPTTAASSTPIIVEPTIQEEAKDVPTAAPEEEKKFAEDAKTTPEISHITIEAVTDKEDLSGPKTAPMRESFKDYDSLFEHGPDPRLSSQTARPALSDLYAEIYAQYNKPKVRLGPRPKQSLDIKRPHTSGTGAQGPPRPVSSLPPGLRAANRKTVEPKRPKSRDSSVVPSIALPPPPPIPAVPEIPVSPTYPPRSPASVRSMPIHSHSSHRASGITPEKQRLMKALELRKKQMKAKKDREEKEAAAALDNVISGPEATTKEVEAVSQNAPPTAKPEKGASVAASPRDELNATLDKAEETETKPESSIANETKPLPTPEESDVGMTTRQTETDDMHSAASASSPTSAQTQGSSCAPSTRPSSISEDDRQIPDNEVKSEDPNEAAGEEKPKEDEEVSIESSPTVVPETTTPVPAVEVSAQTDDTPDAVPQVSTPEDILGRRSKRESMVLMLPSDPDDTRAHRRSKRESMLFMPSPDSLDPVQHRRSKRESMVFTPSQVEAFGENKEKRHAILDPAHLSAENSEAEYLSDDSFMEELQSAKFEEAMPISVSKSPITPFFPRKASMSEYSIPERSSSQQYMKPSGNLTPEQPGSRKSSGPWLTHANTDTVVMAKKINVSSGISQRIKALAEKSNRDSTASVSLIATPDASTSIVAQRKSSFFNTPPSGNSPPGKPVQRLSRASFINVPNSPTPDKKPLLQLQPPPTTSEQSQHPVYNVQQGFEKPESVQVTARIVRDARVQKPTLTMPTDNTPLELHQSPIIIDHQRTVRPLSSVARSPTKAEPTSPRPPSSSHSRETSIALPRSSSESSWRSFGRRLSESKSGPPRSLSAYSLDNEDEKQEKKEKKDSRTSKLFKRMSSISSISRKNSAASSMLPEEDLQATHLPSLREPPPPVQVGDLNIQFPDTLLWKRRWVEVDVLGNLVLSLSKSNEQSKGITKRFHLTEFCTPYAPDQDRQELPNSVVLDFIDGRTLQCACETYVAQAQVLQILREAHDAWLAYNQGQ